MKYFLLIAIVAIVAFSCNTPKKTTTAQTAYWKLLKSADIPENYTAFKVYSLNESAFLKDLESGTISLPDDLGNINTFSIEESSTMSPELAAKFPDLKSYKGVQTNNELCKPRIEKNKTKIKISVLCNDKTYFIDKDNSKNIYIVYNKENAPKGTGVISE